MIRYSIEIGISRRRYVALKSCAAWPTYNIDTTERKAFSDLMCFAPSSSTPWLLPSPRRRTRSMFDVNLSIYQYIHAGGTIGSQFVENFYAPLLRNNVFKALVIAVAVAGTAALAW